jgi:hypothetical protein
MAGVNGMHPPAEPWRFIDQYRPMPGVYDEMIAGAGELREHCTAFVMSVDTMGPQEFAVRRDNAGAPSARTASPTTSTATRAAWTAPGSSTRSRS